MSRTSLRRWEAQFRKDARTDQYHIFRKHLRRLEWPDEPELLVEGTISLVMVSDVYAQVDGRSFEEFLAMQRYDASEALDAKYAYTFDIFDKAFARLLVNAKSKFPDLADLYGHPWQQYRLCGYRAIAISRTDQRRLGNREAARIERDVENDLRYDYGEDELDVSFDNVSLKGVLLVSVQDVYPSDE